jgi:hypothetical protein
LGSLLRDDAHCFMQKKKTPVKELT